MNKIICGDALEELRKLPDGIVQTCITSPPYYGLRDYGVPGQIGLEDTPEAYIVRLVEVFREVRRVLRDDGTLWVNIGDSYGTGTKAARTSGNRGISDFTQAAQDALPRLGGQAKQLLGIPWRLAFALQADNWILRSDIIWHKPNCMPESVEDRPTKSHEYIFLLSKSEQYFYDREAILEPHKPSTQEYFTRYAPDNSRSISDRKAGLGKYGRTRLGFGNSRAEGTAAMNPLGRNKRSVWTVATSPYSEAHFATFPPKLIEPCILAGSRPGDIVLDCFAGAGTTALVSLQHHRQYIAIELNEAYVKLINERINCVQPVLWEMPA